MCVCTPEVWWRVLQELELKSGVACVHCSAGVGRTGTYIAIDIVMTRLRALSHAGADPEAVAAALDVDGCAPRAFKAFCFALLSRLAAGICC